MGSWGAGAEWGLVSCSLTEQVREAFFFWLKALGGRKFNTGTLKKKDGGAPASPCGATCGTCEERGHF